MDSLILPFSPARHSHYSLVLPESDPAMTMNRTEAVPPLLASLQLPAHLRSSSYDRWEAREPFDQRLPPQFSCNCLRRLRERDGEFVHSMDDIIMIGNKRFIVAGTAMIGGDSNLILPQGTIVDHKENITINQRCAMWVPAIVGPAIMVTKAAESSLLFMSQYLFH
eukprot:scaffold58347_cov45-Cyclotella_meneghiniana.AAC.1